MAVSKWKNAICDLAGGALPAAALIAFISTQTQTQAWAHKHTPAPKAHTAARSLSASTVPTAPGKSRHFDAVKNLPRAALSEVYGWRMIEHVSLQSDINTKTAQAGDKVWGYLDDDCRWGSKLIAARDSIIIGHLEAVKEPRTLLKSSLSRERRFHTGGSLTIQFDELLDQDGVSWPIVGKLCRWEEVTEGSRGVAPRLVQIDKNGAVIKAGPTLTDKEKSAFAVARIATSAPVPVSVLVNVVALPAAMGIASAAYPAFAYNKPVDMKEKGVRAKAFAYGFATNLPGASVVTACVQKGDQVSLRTGDRVVVDMTFRNNPFCNRSGLSVKGAVIKSGI